MSDAINTTPTAPAQRAPRSTRKKDSAPRGVFRHPSGAWAIRFTCGAGHVHEEKVGPIKGDAFRAHAARRQRTHGEPGWCPVMERRQARALAQAEEARRVTFRQYAAEYLEWAKLHHHGWRTEASRITAMEGAFGDAMLDSLSSADVERFLDGLLVAERSQSTRNRYRTLLHAMLNRARRHGRLATNPVQGVPRFKEPEGRTLYLMPWDKAQEEAAIRDALRPDLRPLFIVSIHMGFRWSEQITLEWRDVDFFSGSIGVQRSKSGYSRMVPMNSIVRSVLMDLAGQRTRPDDPSERVFKCTYVQPDKFFPRAVERARKALMAAGQDSSRLDGYTWHCNRHTFASRLVMAGVDLRTVQVLGGWRTLAMVQRYSHLAPAHLQDAVERLVTTPGFIGARPGASSAVGLGRNLDGAQRSGVGVS